MKRPSLPALPTRPANSHKGTFGRVLIVGGSESMIGAPVLAGTAALRSGAGLVQIAVPAAVLPAALSITPELIGLPLQDRSDANLISAAAAADVLAVGPGMGTAPAARRRLLHLLKLGKPTVLDADALNILSAMRTWPALPSPTILTPHPGEMKRLCGSDVPTDDAGRAQLAQDSARRFGAIVLLKGHRTVISDGTRVVINRTGNSALAKAGSGDVLTGLIASLLAQKMNALDAAVLGAHLHGRAGELASKTLGQRGVLAGDVINCLPAAMNQRQ